ncbi:MAG: hypothetical protein ABSF08_08645 [Candidatus Cybelea sp.]
MLNRSILDEMAVVSDEDASRPSVEGKVIVVLLADTAERYITTPLFS